MAGLATAAAPLAGVCGGERGSARSAGIGLIALLIFLVCAGAAALAHEVAADARLNIFIKPQGKELHILVRAPLGVMTEVEFPLRDRQYLDVARADEALRYAARQFIAGGIELFENGAATGEPTMIKARVSLPSDRSFRSWEEARALLDAGKVTEDDLVWSQQFLDALIVYPITSDASGFALRLNFDRLAHKVVTTLRFLPPGGVVRAYEVQNDPGLIYLDPSRWQAALSFTRSGFWHILEGIDHLLFLLCLVIPFRQWRPLVAIVTGFTLAHSISLMASALGFVTDALWFPPLVETLIAATIVYMALENIVGSSISRRWVIAFVFGLVHGFGFSFGLKETLQFAGDHLVVSLLAFNVGVEIGQLCVLLVAIPALIWLFRFAVAERVGIVILSALVAHTAWHWMMERGAVLAKFPLPQLDAAFIASLMRGAMALIVMAGVVWAAQGLIHRWLAPRAQAQPGE